MPCPITVCLAIGLPIAFSLQGQVSAGVLPTQTGSDGEATVTQSVAPTAAWVGVRERFNAYYTPRFFWSQPNPSGADQPLLLHSLGFQYEPVHTTRASWSTRAGLHWGTLDYSAATTAFGQNQTSSLSSADTHVLTGIAAITGSRRLTRRWTLSLSVPLEYDSVSGRLAGEEGRAVTKTAGVFPTLAYALTRRDRLAWDVGGQVVEFDRVTGANTVEAAARASMSWSRTVSPSVSWSSSVGAGRTDVLAQDDSDDQSDETRYFGIASFSIGRARQRGADSAALSLGVQPDPIRQVLLPVATLSLTTSERLTRRANFTAGLTAFAPATTEPSDTESEIAPTETGATLTVAATWALPPVTLTTGMRLGARGPHWSEPFDAREQEIAGYLAINWEIVSANHSR